MGIGKFSSNMVSRNETESASAAPEITSEDVQMTFSQDEVAVLEIFEKKCSEFGINADRLLKKLFASRK
ncbi:MAG: hypothetical protein V1911_01125 [Candidatus Micrarchaeota archaeon]